MKPDITIITPSGDRPWSLRLLSQYILRQTFPGTIQWIVVSDSQNQKPYEQVWTNFACAAISDNRFINGAMHQLPYQPDLVGAKSLAQNLLWGLGHAEGELTFIGEDDDRYGADHLKECVSHLAKPGIKAVGTIWQRYYHLPSLSYRTYKNVGSALCSTAFHSSLKGKLMDAARWCGENNQRGIDRRFWDSLPEECKDIFEPKHNQVIGMKGLPGREGIGVGHRPRDFIADADALTLKAWVGDHDAKVYLKLRSDHYHEAT